MKYVRTTVVAAAFLLVGSPVALGELVPLPAVAWADETVIPTDPGAAQQPSLAVAGNVLNLVWTDDSLLAGAPEIMYRQGAAGGAWGAPVRVAPGLLHVERPRIAVTPSGLVAVWSTNDTGVASTSRSIDGGASWSAPVRLGADLPYPIHRVVVTSAAGVLIVAFSAVLDATTLPPHQEIFVQRSLDGGASWSPSVMLSSDPVRSHGPTIASANGVAYLAWISGKDATQRLLLASSTTGGATWSAAQQVTPTALDRLPTDPFASPSSPSIAASGDTVHIAYERDVAEQPVVLDKGNAEIYYIESPDRGAHWLPQVRISYAAGASASPAIAVLGTRVAIAFMDNGTGQNETFIAQSETGGATWAPAVRLTGALKASRNPTLALTPNLTIVVYQRTTIKPNIGLYVRAAPATLGDL